MTRFWYKGCSYRTVDQEVHCEISRREESVVALHTQLFHGENTVSHNSAAMCTSVCPVSLLAVVVVAFVVHPAPVVCQCTTGHCHDDGDNDVSVLTAMVSRLQDTVEQIQQQLKEQHKQFTKLSDTLENQKECMYSLCSTIVVKHKR